MAGNVHVREEQEAHMYLSGAGQTAWLCGLICVLLPHRRKSAFNDAVRMIGDETAR